MLCQAPRNYVLIPRARMQMRRGIAEADVATVLETPGQSEEVRPGRCVYQSRLTLADPPKVYVLRVFVDIDRQPAEVVTVYRTSKVQKCWR